MKSTKIIFIWCLHLYFFFLNFFLTLVSYIYSLSLILRALFAPHKNHHNKQQNNLILMHLKKKTLKEKQRNVYKFQQ